MSNDIEKTGQYFDGKDRGPEIPEFIIERDEEDISTPSTEVAPESKRKKWLRRIVKALAVALIVALTMAAFRAWEYYYNIGVPVSTTPKENINKLKMPAKQEKAEVIVTSDSILGVDLVFHAIHGLRADIEFEEPDTADASVFLYCRSVDHTADSTYLGSLVVAGKELRSDHSRLGSELLRAKKEADYISMYRPIKEIRDQLLALTKD